MQGKQAGVPFHLSHPILSRSGVRDPGPDDDLLAYIASSAAGN
jgi:hypothetical protein